MADDFSDLERLDLLPDCRAREGRGAQPVKGFDGVTWEEPVYCANCGVRAGYATQVESLTFIFVLCDDCGRLESMIAASAAPMPDEVTLRYIKQEQLDVHGRELTPDELRKVVESDTSPLATLLKKGR